MIRCSSWNAKNIHNIINISNYFTPFHVFHNISQQGKTQSHADEDNPWSSLINFQRLAGQAWCFWSCRNKAVINATPTTILV
jgi:hypothetical protein